MTQTNEENRDKPDSISIRIDDAYNRGVADTLERVREIVKNFGHKQEDGSIWCNIDDLLRAIKTMTHIPLSNETEVLEIMETAYIEVSEKIQKIIVFRGAQQFDITLTSQSVDKIKRVW
jgi:predicted DNA-binding protein (UPF0278 family)